MTSTSPAHEGHIADPLPSPADPAPTHPSVHSEGRTLLHECSECLLIIAFKSELIKMGHKTYDLMTAQKIARNG